MKKMMLVALALLAMLIAAALCDRDESLALSSPVSPVYPTLERKRALTTTPASTPRPEKKKNKRKRPPSPTPTPECIPWPW